MNIYPTNLTKLCISISKNPGRTGSKFHNTAYNLLDLDYVYMPFKLDNLKNSGVIVALNNPTWMLFGKNLKISYI